MIETRKQYTREFGVDKSVSVDVVYDDSDTSKTYVNVTDDTGTHEFLLAPPDLKPLVDFLHEALYVKLPALPPF
ncbi:hypothetical protein [Streptomyces sp. CBMA29]|uniref:hypothetical protein n=1 Tax=Streptomyces sp. CBMA29 TaxID=1896314 RepID=UPI0016618EDD|nr:hypothetical protein [Streptomyces sp. CBMA29]MBD0739860.1 hypothetical protein [Streptomyces sp. CBMA29]